MEQSTAEFVCSTLVYEMSVLLTDSKTPCNSGSLKLIYGDGWKGLPEEGPYDAIHVGAAAASVPKALVDQLSPGGRMVIPVGPEGEPQVLAVVDKRPDGHVSRHDLMDVQYVPLVQRQRER
jgi:protein-L-isoaspartate(D-aspartate) O-methyltransferase